MKIKRTTSYIQIKNINFLGYNGIKPKYKASFSTPVPPLTPVKRNFLQKIWHEIKSLIRANSR